MSVKFIHRNPNALKNIIKRYKHPPKVAIGFPSSKTKSLEYPDGESVIVVAAQNEFGDPERNIPRRPFMSLSKKPAEKKAAKISKKLVPFVTKGTMKLEEVANILGQQIVPIFKRTAVELRIPPNAPSTIRAKKSDNPLVGKEGLLIPSITYEVIKTKGEG